MFRPSIGDYCLFHKPGSPLPPWPAFICPDDFAPKQISETRPLGYNYLVILVKEKPEFCYALASELQVFDPCQFFEETGHTAGLELAYTLVYHAMDFGSALDYWREKTEDQRIYRPSPKRGWSSGSEDDSDSDPAIKEAKRRSRVDLKRQNKTTLFKMSASPPKRQRSIPRLLSPGVPADIRRHFPLTMKPPPADSSSQDLPIRLRVRPADVVEGDISESDKFVIFPVGPEREPFSIPWAEVQRRDYFSNLQHGHLRAEGESGWTIELPDLALIAPDDFRHVADFLCTGTFGHRVIEDNHRAEAMAQLVAAWEVGERFGMRDLLEHIVPKAEQCMPWEPVEVLAFAIVVYRTEGTWLEEVEKMKHLLTDYMADNYYEMVEELGKNFTSRIRQIPELERDVHRKIAERAEERGKAVSKS